MKKKLISVLLSAAMATTMLAGCGSSEKAEDTSKSQETSEALPQIPELLRQKRKQLRKRPRLQIPRQRLIQKKLLPQAKARFIT